MFTAARRPTMPWIGVRRLVAFTMIAQMLTLPSSAFATLNKSGRWISSPDLGYSGTHVAVLRMPGTDTTSVFIFGESSPQTMKFWRFAPGDTNLRYPTLANTLDLPHPNDGKSDLFCSGHATLPDGRLLLVGGFWLPEPICQHVFALDPGWRPGLPAATPWDTSAIMAVERWYATATPMHDGKVLASAGTMASLTIGFGGLFRTASGDTTYDLVRPLWQAGRYSWGNTTTIPADNVVDPNIHYDTYTDGKWPSGREGHGFVADGAGRGVMMLGRSVGPVSGVKWLDDVWSLRGSKAEVDTILAWDRFEPVGDDSLPPGEKFPKKRYRFAMTWAGVEGRSEGRLPDAIANQTCFIHGGLDSAGNVLGDLWRGDRRQAPGQQYYQWVWKRLLADESGRRRFGHTMVFDPGLWATGATAEYARLLIHGGQTAVSPPAFADPSKLYTFGVGSHGSVLGIWAELTPTADYGAPTAVEGHAMAAIIRGNHVKDRRYYMFGGQNSTGNLVAPDLWYLVRPDTLVSQLGDFSWEKISAAAGGPTARTRASMSYNVDGTLITIVGGDTTGSSDPGGFTNEVWTYPATAYGGENWRKPPMRNFHEPPPGVAGMPLLTSPEGHGRISRSLERFRADASSGSGPDCPALPGQWETVTLQNDADSERPIADYPYMFQLPDGRMFNAGPAPYSDLTKRYRRFFNFSTSHWADTSGDTQDPILFGSAVMYRPGKLLRAGAFSSDALSSNASDRTETLTITAGQTPAWSAYSAASAKYELLERKNHNLTLLPTGDVLATGGHDEPDLSASVQEPKLWSVALSRWNSSLALEGELLASDPNIRNYHSTAILLPDARVMTAGGEGLVGENPDQTTASIYEPGYLFRSGGAYADRPRVVGAPAVLTYGRTFTLTLDSARTAHIKSIALMRPGAVTHSFDQNQRYVPLSFTLASNPIRLLVQAPADAYIAPPGDQMLFILDSLGADAPRVPSIARWTRTENGGLGLDSADVLTPGMVTDLEGCPHYDQVSGELYWTEPADDGGLAASGAAVSYDLRYKVGSSSPDPSDWATGWTTASLSSPVTPGAPGGGVTAQVFGLSPETKYWFRVRTLDDNGHWSALSNAALIWTREGWECEGGSFAGGGGGGFSARRVAGNFASRGPLTGGTFENSLLDAGPYGTVVTDALRLPTTFSSGNTRLWFRTHAGIGSSVDRARLLVVSHGEGEEVYLAGSAVLVGTTRPIASARLRGTGSLNAPLRPADGSSLLVLPGDTLEVDLGDSPGSALIAEGRSVGGRGPGEGLGFTVLCTDAAGDWNEAGRACLRQRTDRVAVAGLSGSRVKLAFLTGAELTGLWSLALSNGTPVVEAVAPTVARNGYSGDATSLTAAQDGVSAWLVDLDTLHLEFALSAPTEGRARAAFLELSGTPVSPRQAQSNRGQRAGEPPLALSLVFSLQPPRPNPSLRGTTIEFTLPTRGIAKLEIFDTQGRRVRDYVARYEAGTHRIEWDLRSSRGRRVAPGIYTYRLSAESNELRRKAVVLP